MKKISFVILLVAAVFGAIYAATSGPVVTATNQPYEWEYVTGYQTRTSITAADSATLLNPFYVQPGYYYVFIATDSIAAAADSIYYRCDVYGYNGTTIVGSEVFGSSLSTGGGRCQWLMPIGRTLIGGKIRIKAIKTSVTVVAKVKSWEVWKMRPIDYTKSWTITQ